MVATAYNVVGLKVYPIKGCQGIDLDQALIDPQGGLLFDREFVLVDRSGKTFPRNEALSCRHLVKIGLISVHFVDSDGHGAGTIRSNENVGGFVVRAPGMTDLLIMFDEKSNKSNVRVHCGNSSKLGNQFTLGFLEGEVMSDEVNEWFGRFLRDDAGDAELLLVRAHKTSRHMGRYESEDFPFLTESRHMEQFQNSFTKFHSFAPLHLVGTASLKNIASKMGMESYPVDAFRANVIVKTKTPFEEKSWEMFSIGKVILGLIRDCPRCIITLLNPQNTAEYVTPKNKTFLHKVLRRVDGIDPKWGPWKGPKFGIYAGFARPPSKNRIELNEPVVIIRRRWNRRRVLGMSFVAFLLVSFLIYRKRRFTLNR